MTPLTKESFAAALKLECMGLCSDSGKLSPVAILDALPAIMDGLKVRMLLEHGINIQDDAPIDPALMSLLKGDAIRGRGFDGIVLLLYNGHVWPKSKKEMNARNIDAIILKGKLAQVAKTIHSIITTES